MKPGRIIHSFDLLRGVAALAVASFHLNVLIAPFWMRHGYLAVDLFFLMSGCVIELAYADRIRKGMSLGDFVRIRFTRLYPLYALGTAIGIGLVVIGVATGMSKNWTVMNFGLGIAAAALFIPFAARSSDDVAFPLNQPAYSLFYEIVVNIGYALAFRWLTDAVLKVIIFTAGFAMIIVVAIGGTIDIGYRIGEILPGFPRAVFGFFLGVYIARLYGNSRVRTGNLQCGLMLMLVVASFCGPSLLPIDARLWDLFFIFVAYPLVIRFAFSVDLGTRFQGLAAVLGRSSYAVYAIHLPIFALGGNIAQVARIDRAVLAPYWGIGMVALVFALSLFLDRRFDTPVRRRLKAFFDARRRIVRAADETPA